MTAGEKHARDPLPFPTTAEREAAILAPYAMHSADSRGRKHAESEHPYRGPFQRDRDRVLHSSAFRRLSGKMQVFTGEMGDYHRTRLTHTHEVASIARTIGRALRLNEDLIEALALLHDIGHPPFGHAGEEALDRCLREEGGFSHNRFALVVVERLERRYGGFPGLNLTREVLEAQAARVGRAGETPPLLEAQVVDVADSITYDAHDVDDAVKLGFVVLDVLEEDELVRDCATRVRERGCRLDPAMARKALVHELIDRQVGDVLQAAARTLTTADVGSADEARAAGVRIEVSAELARQKRQLEARLFERVYRHERLVTVRAAAQQRVVELFEALLEIPDTMPRRFVEQLDTAGVRLAVAWYIAGMTDRYCDQQWRRLVGGSVAGAE